MMWLGLYQSASIWLCFGPTSPHNSTVPQVQIGGRPIAQHNGKRSRPERRQG